MGSRAKLFGHSIHPMLITLPLGLLVAALIFDVIQLLSPGGQWAVMSYWMIVSGIIGGLVAAVFGLIDYRSIPSDTRARRVGQMHGIGNVFVLLLFGVSAWMRHWEPSAPTASAMAFSAAGGALALVTAWLGGELVERLGVGVHDGAHVDAPSSLSGESIGRRT